MAKELILHTTWISTDNKAFLEGMVVVRGGRVKQKVQRWGPTSSSVAGVQTGCVGVRGAGSEWWGTRLKAWSWPSALSFMPNGRIGSQGLTAWRGPGSTGVGTWDSHPHLFLGSPFSPPTPLGSALPPHPHPRQHGPDRWPCLLAKCSCYFGMGNPPIAGGRGLGPHLLRGC